MKKIIFTYNFTVNYIMHIFAVGKISYNSEYADQYLSTIRAEDLNKLEKYKHLLEFGSGKVGSLTLFCLVLPAYLELKTKENFMDYYDLLIEGILKHDFSRFLQKFSIDFEDRFLSDYKTLMLEKLDDEIKELKQLISEFKEIGKIFINNIERYKPVWKQVEPILKERVEKLNLYFKESNIIEEWEKITGKKFLKDKYYILLCYANKNGPNAISLSYDKNIFYYGSSDQFIIELVSHEIGTHLLHELVHLEKFNLLYAGVECLALFYNSKVLKKEKLSYSNNRFFQLHAKKFLNLYNKYYYEGITPEKLLELVLKEAK